VCPVVDGSQWSGIGISDARVDEVTLVMEDDPGVRAGLFTFDIHPIRSLPGTRSLGEHLAWSVVTFDHCS